MGVEAIRMMLDERVSENPPVYRFGRFDRLLVKELLQAYDGLKAEGGRLRHLIELQLREIESLKSQLKTSEQRREEEMCRSDCLVRDVESLRSMEARVKDGKLTEEEFQAICHDLLPDDEERFMRGCHAMWQRLFKRVETRRVAEILGIKAEDLLEG